MSEEKKDYIYSLRCYFMDLFGWETETKDDSFVAYSIVNENLWICEMYVPPENRKNGIAKELVNRVVDIGLKNNCKTIYGQVELKKNGMYALHPSVNLMLFITHGLIPIEAHNNRITLAKNLEKF